MQCSCGSETVFHKNEDTTSKKVEPTCNSCVSFMGIENELGYCALGVRPFVEGDKLKICGDYLEI